MTDFNDLQEPEQTRQAVAEAMHPPPKGPPLLPLIRWEKIPFSKTPAYLVKGLIPRGGLTIVYGPPKSGKTFWLLDLLLHVAMGWEYRGRRVKAGSIVYCLFEGQSEFGARVEALRQRHQGRAAAAPILLMPVRLSLVKDHPRLIESIRAQANGAVPAAVVLDTLNRSFTGSESSDEAMTAYVAACDAIREAFGCAVIIVHHSGLAEGRPRGHTALLGSGDALIGVGRDAAQNVVAKVEFMKDGRGGDELVSRLEEVVVGKDDDGELISSCIVVPIDGGAVKKAKPGGRGDETLKQAFDDVGAGGTTPWHVRGTGPLVQAVRLKEVRREFCRRYTTGENKEPSETAKRQAWKRAWDAASPKYASETATDGTEWAWQNRREAAA